MGRIGKAYSHPARFRAARLNPRLAGVGMSVLEVIEQEGDRLVASQHRWLWVPAFAGTTIIK
jgi:hypothetical protein